MALSEGVESIKGARALNGIILEERNDFNQAFRFKPTFSRQSRALLNNSIHHFEIEPCDQVESDTMINNQSLYVARMESYRRRLQDKNHKSCMQEKNNLWKDKSVTEDVVHREQKDAKTSTTCVIQVMAWFLPI